MKRILKRTLAYLILLNIVPLILVLVELFYPTECSLLYVYLTGFIFPVIALLVSIGAKMINYISKT